MELDYLFPLIVPSSYVSETIWDLPHHPLPNKDFILTWVSFQADEAMVYLTREGKVKEIRVYGSLRDPKSEARAHTPKDFLTVYDQLIHFKDQAAKEWLPDTIEVMATRYSYAPEKPLKWNAAWNDPKSPTTVKRNDNLYSIYLTKNQFPDLVKLLRSMKEKQAVEIPFRTACPFQI
jgi:hypothetical protein